MPCPLLNLPHVVVAVGDFIMNYPTDIAAATGVWLAC